jgi:hypothetical protein
MKYSISVESELKDILYSTGWESCLYRHAHTISVHSCKQWHMRSPSAIPAKRSIRAASCQRTAVIASEPTEQGWSDTCGGLHVRSHADAIGASPKASESPEQTHLPRTVAFIHRTLRTILRASVWGMRGTKLPRIGVTIT